MLPTSNKTISVIVPCYKYAHYLEECLRSIAKQTYPVLEVIVSNDKSPDEDQQRDIVMKLREELKMDIKLVTNSYNGGLACARNFGIMYARGEYIMCLDADDKLIPGAIEEHMKLLEDAPEKSIAQCALMEFGDRHVINVPNPQTSLERVMQANTIYCNAVFPKKAWEEVGGYDESETMRLGYEDWEFWIRLLAAGYQVRTSDFIALRYRVHEGQMTQATAHPRRQELYRYIYEKHKDLYESRNLSVAGMIKQ